MKIERLNSVISTVTATNSTTTSPKVPFGAVSGGILIVDTLNDGANKLVWHTAFHVADTARPVQVDGANLETAVAADKAYAIPDELFGAPFIVAVTNAGTATFRLSVKG